jgi:hypothetical protein
VLFLLLQLNKNLAGEKHDETMIINLTFFCCNNVYLNNTHTLSTKKNIKFFIKDVTVVQLTTLASGKRICSILRLINMLFLRTTRRWKFLYHLLLIFLSEQQNLDFVKYVWVIQDYCYKYLWPTF